jgi:hypothetical protein
MPQIGACSTWNNRRTTLPVPLMFHVEHQLGVSTFLLKIPLRVLNWYYFIKFTVHFNKKYHFTCKHTWKNSAP